MKKIVLNLRFAAVAAFGLLLMSCSKDESADPNPGPDLGPGPVVGNSYDVMQLGEIPIGLWVTPPADYQNSTEYARIKECGLNFVNGFHYNENSNSRIVQVLDLCQQNGLKFFANKATVADAVNKYAKSPDPALLKAFVDGIKPYEKHPAFAGELLMDEPGKPLFDALSEFTKVFEARYPDKLWHVNLFPTYATGGIQAPNYLDYINTWMTTMSPKLISYDSYPLLTDGTIISDYFYNLDIIRAKSRFKQIPFWTFIQTLSIAGTPGVPDKREPSEADIRWQVWSNLAFGAKGIQYFCYWSPGNGSEQFGNALIDIEGKKTVRYDYVKKLNADIHAIGKIVLKCHAEGAILTSEKTYKVYEQLNSFGEIDAVSGDGSLVGCFIGENNAKKVLITTLTPDKAVRVVLNVTSKVSTVNVLQGGVSSEKAVTGGKLEFSVNPGEAILVEF